MTYFKSCIAAVALFAGYTLQLSAQDTLGLPEKAFPQLEQILERAVKQSPRMILRNLDLAAAEGDRIQARAGLLPSFGGYFQYTYTHDQREDLPGTLAVNKIGYNFTLTQPIFYWNERVNGNRIGVLRKRIAEDQFRDAYGLLAQEIRTAYLRLIVAKVGAKQAAFNRDMSEADLKLTQDRRAKNAVSDVAVFEAGIAADQSRNTADLADADFLSAKNNFSTLTGEAPPPDEQIPDEIPFQESSQTVVAKLEADFLSQKDTETRAAKLLRQQAEVDDLIYRNTKKRLLPKLNALAGISEDQQSYTINTAQRYALQSEFVGFAINWQIFDGFATRGAIASALARKRQSAAVLKQYNDTLGQNVQNLVRRIAITYRQMNITDRLVDSRKIFLKSRKDDFVRGDAAETDVNVAQAGYNNAIANSLAARSSYMLQLGDLLAMISADPLVNKVPTAESQ